MLFAEEALFPTVSSWAGNIVQDPCNLIDCLLLAASSECHDRGHFICA